MTEKLNINFVKNVQRTVEPSIRPGETALEAIKRMEAERVSSMIQSQAPAPHPTPKESPAPEVIFFEGYKLPRDFFTCVALCIMKLNNPEINDILAAFGFTMNDLTGKPVVLKRPRPRIRRQTSKK
jgi:hypothetical protein